MSCENRYQIKLKIQNRNLDCSRFLIFLDVKANLRETSQYLSAQMAVLSSFLQVFIVLGMCIFVFLLTYWKWHWQSEENPIFGLYSRVLIKGDSLAEAKEEKPLKAPTFFETQDTGTKVSRFCKMEQKVFTTMHSGAPELKFSRQAQVLF